MASATGVRLARTRILRARKAPRSRISPAGTGAFLRGSASGSLVLSNTRLTRRIRVSRPPEQVEVAGRLEERVRTVNLRPRLRQNRNPAIRPKRIQIAHFGCVLVARRTRIVT